MILSRCLPTWSKSILLAMAMLLFAGTVVFGEENNEAVMKGKKALSSHSDFPWYDSKTDSMRPIELKAPRQSQSRDLSWLADLFRGLGWAALAMLLVGIAYMLIIAFLRRETGFVSTSTQESAEKHVLSPESIEALPMGAETPISDLLAAARECYQRGDFQRAIVLLFSHQLVQLDKYQLLRLTKGKTNRQYLREIRRQGPSDGLAPLVERTMLLFERAFFGRHVPSREQFESCWSQLEHFESLLTHRAEATA